MNRAEYADHHVQHFYVVDSAGKLTGVLRMNDLLFSASEPLLTELMIPSPLNVVDTTPLKGLQDSFEGHQLFGVPVVDAKLRFVVISLHAQISMVNLWRVS